MINFRSIISSIIILSGTFLLGISYGNPPSFEENFAHYLDGTKQSTTINNENLRDLSTIGVDKEKPIVENIKNILYPDSIGQGGKLRDILKILGLIVFVGMIIYQGFNYILYSDSEDKIKGFHINIAYIFLGGVIFFSATWLLGIGLGLNEDGGSVELLKRLDQGIIFQIFAAIRAGAFFSAIVLLGYYGWTMISSMDDEEKPKQMRQGIINILVVLVSIKLIDYIYFIAQLPEFKSKATELIVEISKVLGYILGGFITLSMIYYGFRLMFSGGDEESLKKVKDLIVAILLGTLVLFLFFLIVYQIVQEFTV